MEPNPGDLETELFMNISELITKLFGLLLRMIWMN